MPIDFVFLNEIKIMFSLNFSLNNTVATRHKV